MRSARAARAEVERAPVVLACTIPGSLAMRTAAPAPPSPSMMGNLASVPIAWNSHASQVL